MACNAKGDTEKTINIPNNISEKDLILDSKKNERTESQDMHERPMGTAASSPIEMDERPMGTAANSNDQNTSRNDLNPLKHPTH